MRFEFKNNKFISVIYLFKGFPPSFQPITNLFLCNSTNKGWVDWVASDFNRKGLNSSVLTHVHASCSQYLIQIKGNSSDSILSCLWPLISHEDYLKLKETVREFEGQKSLTSNVLVISENTLNVYLSTHVRNILSGIQDLQFSLELIFLALETKDFFAGYEKEFIEFAINNFWANKLAQKNCWNKFTSLVNDGKKISHIFSSLDAISNLYQNKKFKNMTSLSDGLPNLIVSKRMIINLIIKEISKEITTMEIFRKVQDTVLKIYNICEAHQVNNTKNSFAKEIDLEMLIFNDEMDHNLVTTEPTDGIQERPPSPMLISIDERKKGIKRSYYEMENGENRSTISKLRRSLY